jgi:ADP-heptose:LPS heptosyltransferase
VAEWFQERGLQPVILEGPADAEAVSETLRQLGGTPPPVLRCDPPVLLKGILVHAALYLGNDAGTTHLSALIGTPTVAIYGPTDPVLWAPRGPEVRLLTPDVECAPCPPDRMRACDDADCLDEIEPSRVFEACSELV